MMAKDEAEKVLQNGVVQKKKRTGSALDMEFVVKFGQVGECEVP